MVKFAIFGLVLSAALIAGQRYPRGNLNSQNQVMQAGGYNTNAQAQVAQLMRRQNMNAQAMVAQSGGNNANVQNAIAQMRRMNQNAQIGISQSGYNNFNGQVGVAQMRRANQRQRLNQNRMIAKMRRANANAQANVLQSGLSNTNYQGAISQSRRQEDGGGMVGPSVGGAYIDWGLALEELKRQKSVDIPDDVPEFEEEPVGTPNFPPLAKSYPYYNVGLDLPQTATAVDMNELLNAHEEALMEADSHAQAELNALKDAEAYGELVKELAQPERVDGNGWYVDRLDIYPKGLGTNTNGILQQALAQRRQNANQQSGIRQWGK